MNFVELRISLHLSTSCTLIANSDGSRVYCVTTEDYVLTGGKELFSFGAGSWMDGPEAKETMSDSNGRWLSCSVNMDTMIIVEKKKIPAHLANITVDKACKLSTIFRQMEDSGQVGRVGFSIVRHPCCIWMYMVLNCTHLSFPCFVWCCFEKPYFHPACN